MQNKHPIITYAYHFMSEAIILFLISLPILFYHYEWVPYGLYAVLVAGICTLFSIYTKFFKGYLPYIVTAPVLVIVFIVSGFPIIIGVVLPGMLTWRYINIRSETILARENTYIRITLILGTGLMLLINDFQIIIYTFLQFLLLIVGYICSHLTVIKKEERKRFDRKLWLLITGIFTAGTVIIFTLFDTGRYVFLKIGEGLSYIATIVVSKLAFLFQNLDFDNVQLPDESSPIGQQENKLKQMEQVKPSFMEKILPFIYWGLVIVTLAFVIFLMIRFLKKQFVVREQFGTSEAVIYGELDQDERKKRSILSKLFGGYFQKPDHPVRKMVYQFEQKAAKSGYGRNAYETIEDWFRRIGINADLAVYQKVRYGGDEVNEAEITDLKRQLGEMEEEFAD
ncbi:hypothetical protein [Virgibacillus dakarensis]|uniref:hypothetical protein n=1 Tax=Virgibacillus dakarensis TaxID=1917889 RepID=UPI000B44AC9B|nr:hypothetical protein [Virgibacillus dakarensis]